MLFVVPVVLFDMLKAKQLACVSESGQKCPAARSLSLRRAWIEISRWDTRFCHCQGRSPYGERGLKSKGAVMLPLSKESLSLRRAWIEINCTMAKYGLPVRRSPYGERGLKFDDADLSRDARQSLSLRRAWIEIKNQKKKDTTSPRSLSLRRAWIEISRSTPATTRKSRRSPYGERGLK